MMDPQMLQKLQQMIFARQGMPGVGNPVARPQASSDASTMAGGMPGMAGGGMPMGGGMGGPGGGMDPRALMALMQKLGVGGAGRKM